MMKKDISHLLLIIFIADLLTIPNLQPKKGNTLIMNGMIKFIDHDCKQSKGTTKRQQRDITLKPLYTFGTEKQI